MTELPPEAAALIEHARRTHGPTQAERERVFAGLHASLATGVAGVLAASATANAAESAVVATQAATAGGKASALGWKALLSWKAGKVVLSTLALGGAIGVGAVSQRPATPAATRDAALVAPTPLRPRAAYDEAQAGAQPPPSRAPTLLAATQRAAPAGTDDSARRPIRAASSAPDDATGGSGDVVPTARPQATRGRAPERGRSVRRTTRASSPRVPSVQSAPIPASLPSDPAGRSQLLNDEPVTSLAQKESAAEPSRAPDPPRSAALAAPESAKTPPVESELALMRRALTQLRDRDAEGALTVLAEHATRYPDGALATERRGLRVVALCAAGLHDQGVRERTAFLAEADATPIAERVRRACSEREP